jgi:hypothetical protein
MTAFLIPPLLILYYAILYAYAIRIAVTGEVPKNLVSPMVLAAGGLAAVALLLFDPRPERGPAARALRWAPPLFLPLSVLGAAAILMRVDQYGWTEFRLLRLVLLVVMAGLSVAAILLLARRRRFPLHVMLLALAAALVLTASGPWGAVAMARRSQQTRLDTALRAAGIDPAATSISGSEQRVPAEVHDDVENLSRYLAQNHGRRSLPPVAIAAMGDTGEPFGVAHRLGLRADLPADTVRQMRFGRLGETGEFDVEGYRVRRISVAPARGQVRTGDVSATVAGDTVHFDIGGQRYSARLAGLARSLSPTGFPAHTRGAGELGAEARLDVTGADGGTAGYFIVLDVALELDSDAMAVQRLDGLLLLRR